MAQRKKKQSIELNFDSFVRMFRVKYLKKK